LQSGGGPYIINNSRLQWRTMMEWSLHYFSWLIGDGEPNRKVGEVFDWFALEFWSEQPLKATAPGAPSALASGDFQYRITAEVVFVFETKAAVIDFGLLAIGNLANFQKGVRVGDFVNGEISIGLPLCIEPIPDAVSDRMSHRWEVSRISADLTPYQNGRRDKTIISYTDVISTGETKAVDYLLHCKESSAISESRTPEKRIEPPQ
jgi:hypothetical protein